MTFVNGVNVCQRCGKEIPEGEHCVPQCSLLIVDKVDEYGVNGFQELGRFTYVSGYAFPFKGYPDVNVQKQVNILKRVVISSLELVASRPLVYFLPLFYPFKKKIAKSLITWYAKMARAAFQNMSLVKGDQVLVGGNDYLDPKKFCAVVRELHRVGMMWVKDKDDDENQVFLSFCMAMEGDNAYRYPFQDILPEINIENLKKNTVKELDRVFVIFIRRDFTRQKLQVIRKLLPVLYFWKDLREFIVKFISELDMEKIKLDEGDWYWCGERWDYNFKDVPYIERKRQRKEIDDKLASERVMKIPEKIEPFIGLAPNKEFFQLSQDEAKEKINLLSEDFIKNTFPKVKGKMV